MHRGAQITRVDGPDGQRGELRRQHGTEVLECRLAGAVAAPALVGLDRGVRRDVEQARVWRVEQQRQGVLHDAQRRHDVHLEGDPQIVKGVVGQRGEWRCPERPGVVDDEVEPAQLEGGAGQFVTVIVVGDVTGDGDDAARPVLPRRGCGRPPRPACAVTAVDHEDHPVRASPVANASPSPRDAPVTIATLMAAHPSERQVRSTGEYNKDFLALFLVIGNRRLAGRQRSPAQRVAASAPLGSSRGPRAVVALPMKLASPSSRP